MLGPAIIDGLQGVLHPLAAALLVSMFNVDAPLMLATIFGLIGLALTLPLFSQYKKLRLSN